MNQVARLQSFYFLVASLALGSVVGPAMNLHMVPYFTDRGLDPVVAVAATTVLFITGAIGSITFGFLADKYSIRKVLATNYLAVGVGVIALLSIHSTPAAFGWAIYMGLVQGGGFTLNQVVFANYFGRNALGAIRGVIQPVHLAANAIGPLAAAFAFDITGNYTSIFMIFGILRLGSGLLVFLAHPPVNGTQLSEGSTKSNPV